MIPESRLGTMDLTAFGSSRQRLGVRQPPAALDGTDPEAPESRRTSNPGGPSGGSWKTLLMNCGPWGAERGGVELLNVCGPEPATISRIEGSLLIFD